MKRCIINYSEGQWYPRGQMRLVESLFKVGYTGHVILLNWFLVEKYQREMEMKACPNHQQTPYAFKYWAFEYASKKGYTHVLWLDSSFWVINPLDSLFDEINKLGYVLQESDNHRLGNWCSDFALKKLGYTRDQAHKMTMYDGGLIGLNMRNLTAQQFLKRMILWLSKVNSPFQGSWMNEKHIVSHDKNVYGHRHDMSVGTMVAYKLHMKMVPKGKYWIQAGQHEEYPKVCILGQGM